MSRYLADKAGRRLVFLAALVAILILLLIALFTFKEGLPAFFKIGFVKFIFGTKWSVAGGEFGILPFILASIYVTLGALLLSVPLGVSCAIFLAEVAPHRAREIVRPTVELLVGIPSVVYGLVGMLVVVPRMGDSLLAAIIVLTVMVLPTIISISEDSLRVVPHGYKEGALALGATHWQAIWHVMLPQARSGITTAVILGMGRAIGETMAMIMVIGNSIIIPTSPLSPARTLTGTLAMELGYASPGSLHWSALFATGVVLFILILALNSIAFIQRREGEG